MRVRIHRGTREIGRTCIEVEAQWKRIALDVSNDTDLVTPIRMVTQKQKRPVFILCPGRWQIAPQLREAASYVRHIGPNVLRAAQFPDTLPRTTIAKPAAW